MATNVSWKGLKAFDIMLKTLPDRIAGNKLKQAYRYALKPTMDEMKENLPPNRTGALWHSIATTIQGRELNEMYSVVGSRKKRNTWNQKGYASHLVEWGSKTHTITAGPGKMMPVFTKAGFTGEFAKTIEHKGVAGTKPFTRAIDSTEGKVALRATDKIFEIIRFEIKNIWSQYGNVATRNDI